MLTFFHACYRPAVTVAGGVVWERSALPYGGGVADQPAVLLEALEYLRGVHQRLSTDRASDRPTLAT